MAEYVLYQITDNKGAIIYVGITKNYKNRVYYHGYAMRTPDKKVWSKSKGCFTYPHKTHLYNKLRKIKEEASDYVLSDHIGILERFNTYQELTEAEVSKIKQCRDAGIVLCNLTDGGEGTPGVKRTFTDEWRKRLSDAKRQYFDNGGVNSFAGKKHTKETIDKIVNTRRVNIESGKTQAYNADRIGKTNEEIFGKERAEEIRKKLSKAKKGKQLPHNEEWERNRINALRGRTKNGTKYRIIDKDGIEIIWEKSLYAFAESIGQKGARFYAALKRGTPTRDGWYIEKI